MTIGETSSAVWYALRRLPGVGPKRITRIAKSLAASRLSLGGALERAPDQLLEFGIDPVALREELDRTTFVDHSDDLPEGMRIITPDDDVYPKDRLDARLPLSPLLYIVGNVDLLKARGIAISGSRSAAAESLAYARALAELLVHSRWNVVSGHAAGVDEMAHAAALNAGGTTTIVAAEGLARFHPRSSINLKDPVTFALVSEFEPMEKWSGYRAMQRNATIAALADAVVVVHASERGGAWSQGVLCIEAGKKLFVPDLPDAVAPGNRKLIQMGAIPLHPGSPDEVLSLMTDADLSAPEQLGLLGPKSDDGIGL